MIPVAAGPRNGLAFSSSGGGRGPRERPSPRRSPRRTTSLFAAAAIRHGPRPPVRRGTDQRLPHDGLPGPAAAVGRSKTGSDSNTMVSCRGAAGLRRAMKSAAMAAVAISRPASTRIARGGGVPLALPVPVTPHGQSAGRASGARRPPKQRSRPFWRSPTPRQKEVERGDSCLQVVHPVPRLCQPCRCDVCHWLCKSSSARPRV